MTKIPRSLRVRSQWCLWKTAIRDEQPTKLPYQVNGELAKSNDPTTWTDFDTAQAAAGGYSGVGFVFAADDPFTGIDLDGCRNPETGEVAPWARDILKTLDTYAEVSPSQTGVKAFIRGKLPWNSGKKVRVATPAVCDKAPAIEVYDHGRYFAVTGLRLAGQHEPQDRQEQLDALCAKYFPAPPPASQRECSQPNAAVERARKYLAKMPPAISGAGGHDRAFNAACVLVCGFNLTRDQALEVMGEWNQTCQPPWSERELQHKIDDAAKQPGERGYLLGHPPGAPSPAAATPSNGKLASNGKPVPAAESPQPQWKPILRRMSEYEPREVSWLWHGRIAAGRVTLLVGMPGTGKSFVTCDMAARVSTGTPWPDGLPCPRGSVILMSAEDDPHDTIRPRLDAHHADVERIHLLSALQHQPKESAESLESAITLADVSAIEEAILSVPDCRLIVADPIGSFLPGKVDSHRENEVRSVLTPIAKLAERYGVAVVLVAHRRKTSGGYADDAALGSRAFTGLARAVWHVARDPEGKHRRLFLPGKNNLAGDQQGLAYSIIGETGRARVAWESDPVDQTADEGLAAEAAASGKPGPEAAEAVKAKAWLQEQLAGEAVLKSELQSRWRDAGGSTRTLERAKQTLRVVSFRDQIPGPWSWRLPPDPKDANNNANASKLGDLGDLGVLGKTRGFSHVFDTDDSNNANNAKIPEFTDQLGVVGDCAPSDGDRGYV